MSSKAHRQQLIATLIAKHAVTNQPQLVELLSKNGVTATQATVSRDLEDLGAVKVRVPGGDTVYAIPEFAPARLAPEDQLRRVMGEWVAEVTHSGPMVVVRTPPGCAHVVASALDRSGMPEIVGTVAGDDTIFC
ncbi:MAG: ArgR family transcriptional regulator, partial [Acidimicrobiia bacterium]|nr:ArgR family transcriptional regulator [Acidimicrobiia bacterium]